jgi:hypothetical protein
VPFCGKASGSSEIGSGRAVSRFLSALLRVERIICLSSRYPKPVCFRKRGTSRSSVSYLALHPMGFSVPRRLRFARWALTPPFHPYHNCSRNSGGIFSVALSVGTTHAVAARVYLQSKLELRGIVLCGVRTFLPRLAPRAILRSSRTALKLPDFELPDKRALAPDQFVENDTRHED